MKKIIALCSILLLTACSGTVDVSTSQIKRPTLDIVDQKPLKLKKVHFKVKVEEKKPQYILDGENFSNLANNMEKIQNHLDVEKQQLEASRHYYDNLNR